MLAGLIVLPFSEAKTVLQKLRDFLASAPPNLNVWTLLRKAPPLPFLPVDVHGREMAYGNRDANFVMNVHGRWETPQENAACIAWTREFFHAAAPHATGGVYVNFMTDDGVDQIASAYSSNYARLAQIKTRYAPSIFSGSTRTSSRRINRSRRLGGHSLPLSTAPGDFPKP